MKSRIKVTVFETIDFDVTGENHVSISGGRATHSFNQIDEFHASDLKDAVKSITINYGTPFIFDDRLELNVSDSKTLSFYLEKVTVTELGHDKLAKAFPFLENYDDQFTHEPKL